MLVMRMNNDTVYDLKNVLAGCKKTASMGYRIAKQESRHLNETLTSAKSEIESTIIDFENSPCYVSAITDLLKEQLFEIRDSFDSLSVLINEDLANLRENLSKFSITLVVLWAPVPILLPSPCFKYSIRVDFPAIVLPKSIRFNREF